MNNGTNIEIFHAKENLKMQCKKLPVSVWFSTKYFWRNFEVFTILNERIGVTIVFRVSDVDAVFGAIFKWLADADFSTHVWQRKILEFDWTQSTGEINYILPTICLFWFLLICQEFLQCEHIMGFCRNTNLISSERWYFRHDHEW